MNCYFEKDIYSIYPYCGENIQEVICRMYSMIEELKANGQVIEPDLINKLNEMIEQLKKKQISIDMFGAKGDGINDDTTAIQTALEFCWKNNIFELYIPEGKYKVSRTIITKEVKLHGLSKPFAPNPIGFDYAYPTLPAKGQPAVRKKWLDQCGGSIIECSEDIHIFGDGLIAENLMIFGDVNQPQQCGVGQDNGGPSKQVILDNVTIMCCGGHAVYAPYGLISPKIRNCRMNSNMGNAIFIGDVNGKYTGETNNVTIEHNDLNRNGKESIYMNVKGRVFNISFNEMEHVGFISHMVDAHQKTAPQSEGDIVYCVKMILSGGGAGFGTGCVTFKNNYSESGYGLLHLEAKSGQPYDVINDVTIENNMWFPHNNDGVNIGIRFKGNIYKPTIWNNKIYTQQKHVLADNSVLGIVSNIPVESDNTQSNMIFNSEIASKPVNELYSLGEYQIGKTAPTQFTQVQHVPSEGDRKDFTRFTFTPHSLTDTSLGFKFQQDNRENIAVGNLVKLDGRPIGIVNNVSTSNNLFDVKGDVSSNIHTSQTYQVSFHKVGGIYLLDAEGKKVKICVHGENVFGVRKVN